MNCESLRELIPAYTIGATDPEETRQVEAGLDACPELAAELAAYRALSSELAEAVPQVAPPVAIWNGIQAAIHAAQPARSAQPARRPPVRQWGWAAAACLALLLVGSNLYWLARLNTQPQPIVLPAAQQGEATNAAAQVVWSPDGATAFLVAERFPLTGPDRVFQAWVRRDEVILSLGTFSVDAAGVGLLMLDVSAVTEPFDGMGITIEPVGGSPGPTSPAVVRWQRPT